ncbi:LRR repeats and ubiquitin-like domain-containing protein At2g30105 isoform X1 [Gossypium arboreum]|uniref:LRR repeats and ubiquitin-like domain-containing protein At2g30105 isoform X1 n=1 Tax=Gossypium arboreum TaxID=29729 RepID=UPI0022F1D3E0|nr:LRR repeats and ubiquitin-like domain-containing protein At2g30105 isoform X1 [Gossypium arboreum]
MQPNQLKKHLQVYLIQLIQVKTSRLDGSSNRIKELPSSLGNCSDLSDLKVSNNLITSLPEDLTNCLKLTKLDEEVFKDNYFVHCDCFGESR